MTNFITRRESCLRLLGGLAALACAGKPLAGAGSKNQRIHIGACDWSIGKMSDPEGLRLARSIGLDGLQVSLGSEANDMHLRQPKVQQEYLRVSEETGVKIASLAIGELNNIPYKSDPRTEAWVSDSIDVARALGVRVVLLAFFHKNDLKGDPEGTKEVIRRLKKVAPKAEKAGVILGLETWLSAEEHQNMMERIGSPAVRVYYDVANSEKMGYNIYEEIRWLGRERICEFHMKENGALLGRGKIDFGKVRQAIDDIGYSGWVQIEGAVPPGATIRDSYEANLAFLRGQFSA